MQNYVVELESQPFTSFRCTKAADSLDINLEKKLKHKLEISADLKSPFNIGLILGASGSGKTTLAKQIYGENFDNQIKIDENLPIIEQFPKEWSYDECAEALNGIGLTSVPCWIRPVKTLSNGQKFRAEAVLKMHLQDNVIIDEWTSVVDRTVAKIMSHTVQKYARKNNKQIILLSCHYDVIEWLKPDWIIDCNEQKFINNRGFLWPERREKLQFDVRPCSRKSWSYFSKYHYLSEKLPGGRIFCFGLFHNDKQIGFQCLANYVPIRKNSVPIYHSNRTVIHPDYIGFGLGIKLVDASCEYLKKKEKCKIYVKFSSTPMLKSLIKNKKWKLINVERALIGKSRLNDSARVRVKTYTFRYC